MLSKKLMEIAWFVVRDFPPFTFERGQDKVFFSPQSKVRERERILFLSRCQAYITSPAFLSGRRVSESVKLN